MHKILILTEVLPPVYGGADIAGFRYAQYLFQSNKFNVTLIGKYNDSILDYIQIYPFIKYITLEEKKTTNWRFKRLFELYNWFHTLFRVNIWMYKNHNNVDVVHSFNSWSNLNLAFLKVAKFYGKRIITETCLIGADDPETLFKEKKKYIFTADYYRKNAYLKADYFISKSNYMTSIFLKYFDTLKVRQIPYFVDKSKFFQLNQDVKNELRIKLKVPTEKKIILFSGELNTRKAVDILVKAFKASSFVNYILVLAGPEGPDKSFVEKLKSEINQSDNIIATCKKVDNIHEWMQIADYFCLFSFKEGFPISVIEALSCGLPIIASDIPEIKNSQVIYGYNGFTAKVGSEIALINLFNKISSIQPNEYRILSDNALKSSEIYDIDTIKEEYMRLYA